jgi:hypothetical protein
MNSIRMTTVVSDIFAGSLEPRPIRVRRAGRVFAGMIMKWWSFRSVSRVM